MRNAREKKTPSFEAATLLFDIGNTHTHVGIAEGDTIATQFNLSTGLWLDDRAARQICKIIKGNHISFAAISSVVPRTTSKVRRFVKSLGLPQPFQLGPGTVTSIGIDYPKPKTIGPDRLANAIAARAVAGAPVIVVDFGTAVTFDVVDRNGNYVGGIIAPGLAAMTDYLHEKTALLPRIKIHETEAAIGKNTGEAMLIGAVHGYRGLIRELIVRLKKELKVSSLPVLATGGYAKLMAQGLPEITAVEPLLTLKGLLIASRAANKH